MLEETEGQLAEHHFGRLRQEAAEAKAQRIVGEEFRCLGWSQTDLASRRKSDPLKLRIAARLRRQTTLSIKQIAERLHLGTTRSASVRLRAAMRHPTPAPGSGTIPSYGLLASSLGCHPEVRTALPSDDIAELPQFLRQLRAAEVSRRLHRADTSSRTKWSRIIFGASDGSSK